MCGPKCSELKVVKPERFHFDPRKTLQQIITVYLNLNSDRFTQFVAYDERSYTPSNFDGVLNRLRGILSSIDYEKFSNLCNAAKQQYKQKEQDEVDFGDEIPDEFQGLFL